MGSILQEQKANGEHSAMLLTFIKLPFVIKIFVLSMMSGRFTKIRSQTFRYNL